MYASIRPTQSCIIVNGRACQVWEGLTDNDGHVRLAVAAVVDACPIAAIECAHAGIPVLVTAPPPADILGRRVPTPDEVSRAKKGE